MFFTTGDGGSLTPEPLAISPWSRSQVGGYAVCGVLARAIEGVASSDELFPLRLTVDLCAPVDVAGLETHAQEVRRGPRLQLVDATVGRGNDVTARGRAVFAAPSEEPPGEMWHREDALPKVPDCDDEPAPPLFISRGTAWSADFAAHQNSSRKAVWQRFPPLVAGEEMSPFVRAAVMAETTSLVCHWGSAGAGFINIDTTLALTRLPRSRGVGLVADHQHSESGLSIGVATMFDRDGYVGTCTVTAIANSHRQLDLGSR